MILIALCLLIAVTCIVQRPPKANPNRRRLQPSNNQAKVLAFPTVVDFTTPNVAMTFAVPVVLRKLPTWLTNTGKRPISASLSTSKLVVTCVYDTPGAVTTVTVDPSDDSIATNTGGVVPAGTFPAA